MTAVPLSSATLVANPTLNASPSRYSQFDVRNINRFAQQFRFFLKWYKIRGQFLEVRGHQPATSNPVLAEFYDHAAAATTPVPITADEPYVWAEPPTSPTITGPTQQLGLAEIVSRFDSRDFSAALLSKQYNQIKFQKRAMRWAILSRLEAGLINGNVGGAAPQEFNGLRRLVEIGLGQDLDAGGTGELNVINEGMTMIRSHRRRVDLLLCNQDAWRKILDLQRDKGFRPQFRWNKRLRQRILYVDGVPVALSDHITTEASSGNTSIFLLSLRKPNGVFGLRSRKYPKIRITKTSLETAPFKSYEAHFWCGLASTTGDALVEIQNWPTAITGP